MFPPNENIAGPIEKSSHYKIASQKSLPSRQFTGKKLSRPGGRRAGRIFAGKLLAAGDFSGRGRSYNKTPAVGPRTSSGALCN